MHYISPFHYLPEDILTEIAVDTNKIKLARKRLLAEIELSDTQSIFINNKELTKFDIVSLFDSLNDTQLLTIHFAIFKDKPLLNFLENATIPPIFNFSKNPKLNTEEAIQFISPYYKEVLSEIINKAIATKDTNFLNQFFNYNHLLTNEDSFEIHEQITKKLAIINTQIKLLKKRIDEQNKITKQEIEVLQIPTTITLLNCLPNDFDSLREDIANNLNNLGCSLINNSYNLFAETLYRKALRINCSDHIKSYFKGNLLNAKKRKRKFPKNYGVKGWLPYMIYFSNGKLVISGGQILRVSIASFFLLCIVIAILHPSSPHHSSSNSIGDFNFDDPFENTHYPAYSKADSNFYKLMYMLHIQAIKNPKKDTTQVKFNKGDNVFESLFADAAFKIEKPVTQLTVGEAPKTKNVKIVNNTNYECVLLISNADIESDYNLLTNNFTSYYLPQHDSIDIKLSKGFNDIRPYMGLKLVKNIGYKASDFEPFSKDFKPAYLFEKALPPRINLLEGLGLKFEIIGDAARLIFLENSKGQLVIEVGELENKN